MAKRLDLLPLEELYDRPKFTPAVIKYIQIKEDFSEIRENYCSKICALPEGCKNSGSVGIGEGEVDILIVYPFMYPDEKTKYGKEVPGGSIDAFHKNIVRTLAGQYFEGLTWGFTYALRCRPDTKKLRVTTLRKCVPYLEQEILSRKPKIVLGLGIDVGKALGLARCPRGYVQKMVAGKNNEFEYPLICSIHPKTLLMIRQNASGQFWGPDYLDILRRDFAKVAMVASGRVQIKDVKEAVAELRAKFIYVASSIEDIKKFYTYLISQVHWAGTKSNVVVSWDTETTGLDPWAPDAKFLCHQFGYKDKGGDICSFVIPLWHRDNDAYDANDAWDYVENILTNDKIVKIPHNGAFDLVYTKVVMGVDVNRVDFDTMLLIHSMNSGIQGQYDLKTSTSDLLFETQLGGYEDLLKLGDLEDEEETDEVEDDGQSHEPTPL